MSSGSDDAAGYLRGIQGPDTDVVGQFGGTGTALVYDHAGRLSSRGEDFCFNDSTTVTAPRPSSWRWLSRVSSFVEGFEDLFLARLEEKRADLADLREALKRLTNGTGNDTRDCKKGCTTDPGPGNGTGNTQSGNRAAVEEMRKQQGDMLDQALRKAYDLPEVCSGGGFVFTGVDLDGVEALALLNYDSTSGGSHGGLLAIDMPFGFAWGHEWMRDWNTWQQHDSSIGFKETSESHLPSGGKRDTGGLFQANDDGSISIGAYGGGASSTRRVLGGGGYMTMSWNGCH